MLETTVCILVKYLPPEFVEKINAGDPYPLGPEDECPDVDVAVEYEPGYHVPARLHGSPDSWAPAEGDPPEINKVWIIGDGNLEITKLIPNTLFETLLTRCWNDQADQEREQRAEEASARADFYSDGEY